MDEYLIKDISQYHEDDDPENGIIVSMLYKKRHWENWYIFEPAYIDEDTGKVEFALFQPSDWGCEQDHAAYANELETFAQELAFVSFVISKCPDASVVSYHEGVWELHVYVEMKDLKKLEI